ncbi:MAG TPA: arginine--tRNA ligase [Solirubrobacteraceae bacterium]|nr:arginine--tRNA ligase [Solirubrobacteraceae bacterium]
MNSPLADLRAAIEQAAASIAPAGGGLEGRGRLTLERPPRADFGDYSSNAALLLAPALGQPPRDVAGRVAEELTQQLGDRLERVEVAGPGFLNLFLTDGWFASALRGVRAAGPAFGGSGASPIERINVEFVSANPTGPVTVASGRHAAFGDALARVLAFHGHEVTREYYVNDYGSQVRRLGESIRARAHGEPVPEDGYQGDYVAELVEPERALSLEVDELARAGVAACLQRIRATMERFGVHFDTWFAESGLHEGPEGQTAVQRALAELERQGALYSADGALWLRSTEGGDDQPRVLRRSSGEYTYFASDIAYHLDKLRRGYDRLIDVWGADHHGYVQRVQAAFGALGGPPGALEIVILQFVHLIERGERASMSKRRGDFVTLDELVGEIGVDAARYFLLARSHDSTVDMDLDLARSASAENPVYYIQYAHARIASMLVKAGEERVARALGVEGAVLSGPLHPAERALVHRLVAFPGEVAEAASRRAPHRIAAYALELAQDFTAFYRDCRVVGAEPEELESWRIVLSGVAQDTIARALMLLGVSAPQSM